MNEVAAQMLQASICDAICNGDPNARAWLFTSPLDSTDPPRYSFVFCCLVLGIDPKELRDSLKFGLVSICEPCYTEFNETVSNSSRAS